MQSNITIQDSLKTFSHDQDKTQPRAHNCLGARDPRQIQNERACQDDAIRHGRLDIPIYISLCGEDATRFTGTKKQMGKGATPQQSEASALMELMERFSFFYFIHQYPFPTYKYGELDDFAVSVRDLKKSIYDTETPDELCEAFLKDFPMRWVKAPSDPRKGPVGAYDGSTNDRVQGPAAGNTLEEAMLQSLCEASSAMSGRIISNACPGYPEIAPNRFATRLR